jgi:hypothetical protein
MLTLQDLLRTRTAQPQLNKAMYFNGVNAYVNLGTKLTTVTDFTALIWVAIVSHPSSWTGVVGYTVYTDRNWWITLGAARSFSIGGGVMFTGGGVNDIVGTPRSLVWAHVGLSKSGNTVKGYYNGVLKWTKTGSGDYKLDPSIPLGIGARNGNGYSPSNVMVSQFLFYSRALSNSEIMHNMSNPNNPIRDGLVLWLDARACDTSKNICYDLSGNNNHGTMYNVQIVLLSSPVRVGGSL